MEQGELDSGRVWYVQREGEVTFGLTDVAVSHLGEVTNIEASELDETVRREDVLFSVEGARHNYEFISPVDGVVCETNEAVIDDPKTISEDPDDACWILKLQISGGQKVVPEEVMESEPFVQQEAKATVVKKAIKSPKKAKKITKNESKKRKKK